MIKNLFAEENMLDSNIFEDIQLHKVHGMDKESDLYTKVLIPYIQLDVKRRDHFPKDADKECIKNVVSERVENTLNLVEISINSVLGKTLLRFYINLDKCSDYPELAEYKGWLYYNDSLWFTSNGVSARDDIFNSKVEADEYLDFINHQTSEELEEELKYSCTDLTTLKTLAMHDTQYQDDIMWMFRELAFLASGFDNIDSYDFHVVETVKKKSKSNLTPRVIDPQDELNFYLEELGYDDPLDDPRVYVLPRTSQVRRKFDKWFKIEHKYSAKAIGDDSVLIILTNDTPMEIINKLQK